MTNPSLWNQLFIWPILNALMALNKGFVLLGIPGSFGWAIISLTVLIRLLLYPLTASQLKSTKKMQDLRPHLDALKAKHGNDKQKLAQAQMELYKKHGVNPAAGCLPLLISLPIFISLYQVFWKVLNNADFSSVVGQINQILYSPLLKVKSLDLYFFGLNLAEKPVNWQTAGWWLLLIPPITAVLYFIQSKMMAPQQAKKGETKKETKADAEEMLSAMTQGPMTFLFPLMIGFFAYSLPLGLSLYWNIFTILGIIQQYITTGLGGLTKAPQGEVS